MPSLLPPGILAGVLLAGSALAISLLLGTVATMLLRVLLGHRRTRAEREMRPMVLAVTSGADAPPELLAARGWQGRAAERIVFGYLARVRGEAATSLAGVLARRGTVARIVRRSHSPRASRRAQAADRLGLIGSPEAERRLAELVISDQNAEVRIAATRALGKTGSAAAARTLLHSLSRPAPVPEGIVASALLELGADAVPGLRAELAGGRPRQARRPRLRLAWPRARNRQARAPGTAAGSDGGRRRGPRLRLARHRLFRGAQLRIPGAPRALASGSMPRDARRRGPAGLAAIFASPLAPPISLIVPVRNRAGVIAESTRGLLGLRYPEFEVIVVDDGSTDATFGRLQAEFGLVPIDKVMRDELPAAGRPARRSVLPTDVRSGPGGSPGPALPGDGSSPSRRLSTCARSCSAWRAGRGSGEC